MGWGVGVRGVVLETLYKIEGASLKSSFILYKFICILPLFIKMKNLLNFNETFLSRILKFEVNIYA